SILSFPTRRSSDLEQDGRDLAQCVRDDEGGDPEERSGFPCLRGYRGLRGRRVAWIRGYGGRRVACVRGYGGLRVACIRGYGGFRVPHVQQMRRPPTRKLMCRMRQVEDRPDALHVQAPAEHEQRKEAERDEEVTHSERQAALRRDRREDDEHAA